MIKIIRGGMEVVMAVEEATEEVSVDNNDLPAPPTTENKNMLTLRPTFQ